MKVGKTTLAKDMKALILECEDGTRAMTGAYGMIMKSWADIKSIARYAKDDKVKAKFRAIAVDTVDVASSLCEKYICNRENVDALGKIPYGGGWNMFKKEFEEVFRGLSLEGYAILFISHSKIKTITKANGTEYSQIAPTVSESINNIVMNMSDIIGYAYQDDETDDRYLILRGNNNVIAGTRFPYMEPKITFGYEHLVKALNDAIDKEEAHSGSSMIGERVVVNNMEANYDYDALRAEFEDMVGQLMNRNQEYFTPRITQITDKYLGKGKKVSETTLDQAEFLYLINTDIREDLLNKK